jgi:hypothetical protein
MRLHVAAVRRRWERIPDPCPEEHIPESRPGRNPGAVRDILESVLCILNTGRSGTAPPVLSNYTTVHRRCQRWCEREVLREILIQLANTLR